MLSLLFEKCRCISKAVVIKIPRFLFFSKGNSDDNVPERLWSSELSVLANHTEPVPDARQSLSGVPGVDNSCPRALSTCTSHSVLSRSPEQLPDELHPQIVIHPLGFVTGTSQTLRAGVNTFHAQPWGFGCYHRDITNASVPL